MIAGLERFVERRKPKPLTLYLDGSDINTASAAEGGVQKSLADFQVKERDLIVENLPDEVIELGKKLPVRSANNSSR